jgi:hypothetical protein
VSKTQFLSEHGRATKLGSSSSLGEVRLMSSSLTAHDVRKQPGITSICGTSDVVKVSTVDCVEVAATAVFKTEYFTPEYLLRVKYYRSNIFCLKIPGTENPENPRAWHLGPDFVEFWPRAQILPLKIGSQSNQALVLL